MSVDDAKQDAAIALIEMRDRFIDDKAAHLPPDRQEAMVCSWARMRLMDQYQRQFREQQRTWALREDRFRSPNNEFQPSDHELAVEPPELTTLEAAEIRQMVTRLPERQARVVDMILFEGFTQMQAAQALGISQPAASVAFEKAKESLKHLLRDYKDKR